MSVSYSDAWTGVDSPACPNYVPTKYELMVLGDYWLRSRWFVEMLTFCGEPIDRRDGAGHRLANERLDLIGEELDAETIASIRAEVEATYRSQLGERGWWIGMHGTPEQKERYQKEIQYEWQESVGPPKPRDVAVAVAKAFPDISVATLADALRAAADHIETHGVINHLCQHDWQVDRQRTRLERGTGEIIVLYERCTKCHCETDREIGPGEPGYDDAKQLADG